MGEGVGAPETRLHGNLRRKNGPFVGRERFLPTDLAAFAAGSTAYTSNHWSVTDTGELMVATPWVEKAVLRAMGADLYAIFGEQMRLH